MPDINGFAVHSGLTENILAVAREDQGPGTLLRTVLVVSLIGIAALAWFLLRGYKKGGNGED